MRKWLGVDLGGTNTKVGLVDDRGLMEADRFPSEPGRGPEHWLERLSHAVDRIGGGRAQAVGLACPGVLDRREGVVVTSPNLPLWQGFPLLRQLSATLGMPAAMGNDVNLLTLGELRFGAGVGRRNLACLALGTGVGGGLVLDGSLVLGPLGTGGELGHTIVEPGGRVCGCGAQGCLEAYASATGLRGMVADALAEGRSTGLRPGCGVEDIAALAEAGDKVAAELFATAGTMMGRAVVNLVCTCGINLVIVGGGVAHSWDLLLGPARREMESRLRLVDPALIEIRPAALGDGGAILGAAALARDTFS